MIIILLIPQHITPASANGIVIQSGAATESTIMNNLQLQNLNRGIWLQKIPRKCCWSCCTFYCCKQQLLMKVLIIKFYINKSTKY